MYIYILCIGVAIYCIYIYIYIYGAGQLKYGGTCMQNEMLRNNKNWVTSSVKSQLLTNLAVFLCFDIHPMASWPRAVLQSVWLYERVMATKLRLSSEFPPALEGRMTHPDMTSWCPGTLADPAE